MDEDAQRFAAVVLLMLLSGFLSLLAGGQVPEYDQMAGGEEQAAPGNYTVDDLMEEEPYGSRVAVTANVSELPSDAGQYTEFELSGDDEELLVVCHGEIQADLSVGVGVTVRGTFKRYQGEDEVFGDCGAVERKD